MAKIVAQLTWTDREGHRYLQTGDARVLAKQLKNLRCEAKLKLLNGEVIGECTRLEGMNPTRAPRWIWSFNSTALEKQSKDSPPHEQR